MEGDFSRLVQRPRKVKDLVNDLGPSGVDVLAENRSLLLGEVYCGKWSGSSVVYLTEMQLGRYMFGCLTFDEDRFYGSIFFC